MLRKITRDKVTTIYFLCIAKIPSSLEGIAGRAPTYSFLQKLSTHWIIYFASLINYLNEFYKSVPHFYSPLRSTIGAIELGFQVSEWNVRTLSYISKWMQKVILSVFGMITKKIQNYWIFLLENWKLKTLSWWEANTWSFARLIEDLWAREQNPISRQPL